MRTKEQRDRQNAARRAAYAAMSEAERRAEIAKKVAWQREHKEAKSATAKRHYAKFKAYYQAKQNEYYRLRRGDILENESARYASDPVLRKSKCDNAKRRRDSIRNNPAALAAFHAAIRAREASYRASLAPIYVKQVLRARGFETNEMTAEIIETMRLEIELKREIRKWQ